MEQYIPVAKHAGYALGGGLAVFLIEVQATIPLDPWATAGISGILAALAGLGIGIAKRSTP